MKQERSTGFSGPPGVIGQGGHGGGSHATPVAAPLVVNATPPNAPPGTCRLTIQMDPVQVGVLLGRGGSNIQHVRQVSGWLRFGAVACGT